MAQDWEDFTHGPPPSGWRLFLAAGGRVVFIGIAALVVLTLLAARDTRVQNAMDSRGETVVARVVVKQKINRDEAIRGSEDRHRVWLRFELPGQGSQVQPKRVDGALYERLDIGEARDIRVLPETPDVIELTPGEFRDDGQDLQGIALVIGAAVLLAIWVFGRRAVSALRARRYGTRIPGHIIDKRARLIWRDDRGRTGKSLKSAPDRYAGYQIGSEVDLYLGPDGRTWWIGDTGPRG